MKYIELTTEDQSNNQADNRSFMEKFIQLFNNTMQAK